MSFRRHHHQKRKKNQDGIKFAQPRGATHLEDLRDVDYVQSVVNAVNAVSVENVETEEARANLLMDLRLRVRVFVIIVKESLRIGGVKGRRFRRRNMQGMDDLNNQIF